MSSEVPDSPARFFRWTQSLALSGDRRLHRLGELEDAMRDGFADLATSVRRSLWHMTHTPTWDEVRSARPLTALERRRGIDARYVTSPMSRTRLPMLSSHHLGMRTGPVPAPLLVVDSAVVFLGVVRGHELAGTVWRSDTPHVVAAATRCFEAVWRESQPTDPTPPFTPRMVDIAFLLTDGATDREIARALTISERTASAEIAEMVRRLGARSRAHAIALIAGGT